MSDELRRALQEAQDARQALALEVETLRAQAEEIEAERDAQAARAEELESDNLDLIDRLEKAERDLEQAQALLERRTMFPTGPVNIPDTESGSGTEK